MAESHQGLVTLVGRPSRCKERCLSTYTGRRRGTSIRLACLRGARRTHPRGVRSRAGRASNRAGRRTSCRGQRGRRRRGRRAVGRLPHRGHRPSGGGGRRSDASRRARGARGRPRRHLRRLSKCSSGDRRRRRSPAPAARRPRFARGRDRVPAADVGRMRGRRASGRGADGGGGTGGVFFARPLRRDDARDHRRRRACGAHRGTGGRRSREHLETHGVALACSRRAAFRSRRCSRWRTSSGRADAPSGKPHSTRRAEAAAGERVLRWLREGAKRTGRWRRGFRAPRVRLVRGRGGPRTEG